MKYLTIQQQPTLPSNTVEYATLFNYSPRGKSELSQQSRQFTGGVKAGRMAFLERALVHLPNDYASSVIPFLNNEVTLVPVPRSSPLAKEALWPSKVIADLFVENGYGKEVSTCIHRSSAIRKSSLSYSADSRPSVQEHYDSLHVTPTIIQTNQITLIDDVLTLGRTTYACVMRIREAYPEATIRVFAFVRTQGFIPDIEKGADPSVGTISYNPNSGKTTRTP